jgi:glycosyltransferase involved in cell wall biosynthesis
MPPPAPPPAAPHPRRASPRRLLYLSPYFPPLARVGALRPLKFVRHLGAHGWEVVVLADLWSGDPWDVDLAAAIPPEVQVVRGWSRRAAPAEAAWRAGRLPDAPAAPRGGPPRWLPAALNNPELLPLGEHGPRIPFALAATRRLLAAQRFDAVLVNCDPFAAALVAARAAAERGLPLLVDLRDPWALCELRRPLRPRPIRALIDALERRVVDQAAAVVLNTEATRDDYRRHYADLPAERFVAIRNHSDADLIGAGQHAGFDRFTVLFLGNFGRFIRPDALIAGLAALRRRGVPADALQLVFTGAFPPEGWALARAAGVEDWLRPHPRVPHRATGAVMAAADLLVLLVQPGVRQRLAAKLFDYLVAERPIVAVGDNPELAELLAASGAGAMVGHGDPEALADQLEAALRAGRQRQVARRPTQTTSAEASAALAAALEAAVDGPSAPA